MLLEVKMEKKRYYLILIFTSLLILSVSLESLIRGKDATLFEGWLSSNKIAINNDNERNQAFSTYITLNLSNMFLRIIIPIALSVHSYFVYIRTRFNKLFILIWTILLIGGMTLEIFSFRIDSIFSYINILLYVSVIITIISLNSIVDNSNRKGD